jgi:nucleoside-specific outer membrane channel protein Tsx
MAAEDFNPGFSFDAGDFEAPAQAPWEFGGGAGLHVPSLALWQSLVSAELHTPPINIPVS